MMRPDVGAWSEGGLGFYVLPAFFVGEDLIVKFFNKTACNSVLAGVLSGMLLAGAALAEDAEVAAAPVVDEPVFAVVSGQVLTMREFERVFKGALGQKFYHGTVPEGQEEVVRREVAEALIERALMEQEIERLAIKPEAKVIDKALNEYDERYKDSPRWQQQREQALPGLRVQLEVRNQFEQLEKQLRAAPAPTVDEVRAFYEANQALFTEPEQVRISVIMLKVDPSSPKAVWDKAREEAQAIYQRLQNGADFAEAAQMHSGDESAAKGGDMGYIHRGMLPEKVEELMEDFTLGAVSEPLTLLQGVALVRLDDRVPPKLRAFEDVAPRATELLTRERSGQAREDAINRLRSLARIEIVTPVVDGAVAK